MNFHLLASEVRVSISSKKSAECFHFIATKNGRGKKKKNFQLTEPAREHFARLMAVLPNEGLVSYPIRSLGPRETLKRRSHLVRGC